jgi:hypothetical protein
VVYWFSIIFFLKFYFLEFDEFNFSFQDTYNILKERYMNNHLTCPDIDLDLWLETISTGGPDRNQVCGLSNTITENLRTTYSTSIFGCSQLIWSSQTSKFAELLDRRVQDQMAYFYNKYEQLTADYEKIYWLVMEMRSQISGSCASSNWPHDPSDDQPPHFPPTPPLF